MSHQPPHVLAMVSSDPAGAWRRGESDVVDRLARLELHASGLKLPAGFSSSATPDRVAQ